MKILCISLTLIVVTKAASYTVYKSSRNDNRIRTDIKPRPSSRRRSGSKPGPGLPLITSYTFRYRRPPPPRPPPPPIPYNLRSRAPTGDPIKQLPSNASAVHVKSLRNGPFNKTPSKNRRLQHVNFNARKRFNQRNIKPNTHLLNVRGRIKFKATNDGSTSRQQAEGRQTTVASIKGIPGGLPIVFSYISRFRRPPPPHRPPPLPLPSSSPPPPLTSSSLPPPPPPPIPSNLRTRAITNDPPPPPNVTAIQIFTKRNESISSVILLNKGLPSGSSGSWIRATRIGQTGSQSPIKETGLQSTKQQTESQTQNGGDGPRNRRKQLKHGLNKSKDGPKRSRNRSNKLKDGLMKSRNGRRQSNEGSKNGPNKSRSNKLKDGLTKSRNGRRRSNEGSKEVQNKSNGSRRFRDRGRRFRNGTNTSRDGTRNRFNKRRNGGSAKNNSQERDGTNGTRPQPNKVYGTTWRPDRSGNTPNRRLSTKNSRRRGSRLANRSGRKKDGNRIYVVFSDSDDDE